MQICGMHASLEVIHTALSARCASVLLRSCIRVWRRTAADSHFVPAIDAWLSGRQPYLRLTRHVDATDSFGSTMLMVASCFGKVAVVARLLQAGADFERRNASGRCALVYACLGPHLPEQKGAILRQLLQAGARAGIPKALQASALLGRAANIRMLTACGALPAGQLVTVRRARHADTDDRSPPSIMDRAMATVVRFDAPSACYECDVRTALCTMLLSAFPPHKSLNFSPYPV
jgi:hypothetical protein